MANIIVEGTRPILWNSFNNELLDIKSKKSGSKGNSPEEWKKSVLVNDSNQLYILPESIFGCIRDGSKYTKNGRGTMQSMITATLQIADNTILTDRFLPVNITRDITEEVYLDVRNVRNPNTRGRNIRYRVAAKAGWKIIFSITWDCTLISPELMEAIIIDSGSFCGLGDGRSIGFGRFKLEKFELVDVTLCQ